MNKVKIRFSQSFGKEINLYDNKLNFLLKNLMAIFFIISLFFFELKCVCIGLKQICVAFRNKVESKI